MHSRPSAHRHLAVVWYDKYVGIPFDEKKKQLYLERKNPMWDTFRYADTELQCKWCSMFIDLVIHCNNNPSYVCRHLTAQLWRLQTNAKKSEIQYTILLTTYQTSYFPSQNKAVNMHSHAYVRSHWTQAYPLIWPFLVFERVSQALSWPAIFLLWFSKTWQHLNSQVLIGRLFPR